MRQLSFSGLGPHGFHRLAYTEWGAASSDTVVVCVHGLTRNGRDFDALAAALASGPALDPASDPASDPAGGCRVVCPDVVGRGRSDWLVDKEAYGYPQYCADSTALIARLGVDRVDWVGTSMGGLIGMVMASLPGSPIRRLVVNDIGPFIPKSALERLGQYVGQAPDFADIDAATRYISEVHAPFGPLSPEQWRHLAVHSLRRHEDGGYELRYDPAIAAPFRSADLGDVDMWAVWDAIDCPVLVLRGAESDLLGPETAEEMRGRGPKAKIVEFAGIGHAPALMADDQIATIRDWLATDGGG